MVQFLHNKQCFPSEVTLQNKKEDDDAKAFDVYYPAHLYYKGNSEKRLENKTLDEAEQFFRVRAKRLWDLLKVDPQTRKSRSGKYMHDVIQKQAFLEKCTVGDDCFAVLVDEAQDLSLIHI